MLDQWLASLSKNTLATLSILGGIAFIVLLNPPHSVCDSQKEIFKKTTESTFFIDPKKKKLITKNRFTNFLNECRYDGKPGGCYEFFESLRFLTREMAIVPDQCVQAVSSFPEVKDALWKGTELMVRLAWGETPPESFVERAGWLSEAEIALFCRLKKQTTRAFGESAWTTFREGQFKKLPGVTDLSRNEAWSRMIFSFQCSKYI